MDESIEQKETVLHTAFRLAQILKEDPAALDKEAYVQGDQWLEIKSLEDSRFPDLNQKKIGVIQQSIQDLASWGKTLASAYMGLTYYESELQSYIAEYGESPLGESLFSVAFRNPEALKDLRSGGREHLSEEDMNTVIYRLTVEWSRLL